MEDICRALVLLTGTAIEQDPSVGPQEDHVCHGITTQEPRHRPMKEILHSRHHSTVLARPAHTRGRFGHSAHRQHHSTEGVPTPNSGRGAETAPEATMHSLTATIRTLPSTAGL